MRATDDIFTSETIEVPNLGSLITKIVSKNGWILVIETGMNGETVVRFDNAIRYQSKIAKDKISKLFVIDNNRIHTKVIKDEVELIELIGGLDKL